VLAGGWILADGWVLAEVLLVTPVHADAAANTAAAAAAGSQDLGLTYRIHRNCVSSCYPSGIRVPDRTGHHEL